MSGLKDLTGQRFGRLTVISRAENTAQGQARWLCECDCGKRKKVNGQHLRNGSVVSCGCSRAEKASKRAVERNTTHGLRHTRLYRIYRCMLFRCYNSSHKYYSRYGGRGISICDEWKNDFSLFAEWALKNGYNDTLSIDRIDVNGNYEPNNCRWVTNKVQSENRTDNIIYEVNGKSAALSYWCDFYSKKYATVYSRLKSGWTIEEALELVPRKK